jgi:putative oxidoreductase
MTSLNKYKSTILGVNPILSDLSLLLLRLTIGIPLFMAGSGKVFGVFGGYGIQATIQGYGKMGFSAPLAWLSMLAELIGGILITLGLLTRPAAFAIMINMLVATIITLPNGFMGPTGAQTPFIFLMVDVAILLSGPMNYSLDRIIFQSRKD